MKTTLVLIMSLSIAFQFLAAFMALRLIRLSGAFIAWVFLACGFFVQAMRRIVSLNHLLTGQSQGDMPVEVMGLIISILMLLGIWKFGPLFSEIKQSKQAMREKNDALQESNRKLEEEAVERQKVEKALKESEQLYRAVAEYSYDWEYWIDSDRNFRYISPYCKVVTGYDRGEFYRDPNLIGKIIHPDDRSIYSAHFEQSFSSDDDSAPLDFRIITYDGYERWIGHVCRPVLDSSGKPNGRRSSNRDITERKTAEKKLGILNLDLQKQASELKAINSELESFSYTLSHDIRNYLTRISLAAQALNENYAKVLDETCTFLLFNINEACEGMENLIQAIILLSKVSKSNLTQDHVDLSELAIEVGNDIRFQYPDRQVEFTVLPGLAARGSRDLLQVMLLNLLGNAWKYTSKTTDARVTFGHEEREGNRVFFVRDNGAGFDMQEADKLFKPFSRLGTAVDYKGIGIGLATVQRIVHAHGGEVWGEGEPGKGATFYFTLSTLEALKVAGPNPPAPRGSKSS